MSKELTCITVDDEPLALQLIGSFVERTPGLKLAGSYLSATDALEACRTARPDVAFLDINMPALSGMDLARLLPPEIKIVFTTAYPEHAVESFRLHAADYLLKPLSYPRFLECAGRLQQNTVETTSAETPPLPLPSFLFVKVDNRLVRIDLDEILYLKGLKDYVSIYVRGRKTPLIATTTMKAIESRLPQSQFCRVHKSYIVALGAVEAVERNRILIGSESIAVTDAYRERFFSLLS